MSKLEIISPDSSLRKQIESAIKPKITLTKKQKPKIIIFEDDKPVKKTKKTQEGGKPCGRWECCMVGVLYLVYSS